MVSYWKLIDMTNADVIGVGNEKSLHELKMLYENKLNTRTKMVKCFGKDNYTNDWADLKKRALILLEEHNY